MSFVGEVEDKEVILVPSAFVPDGVSREAGLSTVCPGGGGGGARTGVREEEDCRREREDALGGDLVTLVREEGGAGIDQQPLF